MTQNAEKIAMVINTASYERVSFGLAMALAAAALGKAVHVLFGHGGVMRLKKGFTDEVGEETAGWIREQIRAGLGKGRVTRISESLAILRKLGGKVYACPAALTFHDLTEDDLIGELDAVRGMVEFLREEAAGATVFYV